MIEIRIRFFAAHRDIVGATEQTRTLAAGTTAAALWEHLVSDYPPLARYSGKLLYAINQELCDPSTELHEGDEVAYLPPVSGGAGKQGFTPFVVTPEPLNPLPLMQWVQHPSDGAVITFAGVVRDNAEGRATAFLTYEAYAEMAVSMLEQLAQEAQAHYEIGHVAIHHRVGQLEIGETAVLVVVAAPHRQPAFEAAAYLMDRIKQVVPIWKREHWRGEEGQGVWKEG